MNTQSSIKRRVRVALALVGRALHHYENRGLRNVVYRTAVFAKRFARNGFRVPTYQGDKRVDTAERWEMIRRHLSPEDANLLDVGCADGVLTAKFREDGLLCVGIDRNERNLAFARSRYDRVEGIGFLQYEMNPDSVPALPSYDVVLLLTVYHWWCRDFGVPQAEEMLRTLGRKSRTLFFEPPHVPINQLTLGGVNVSGASIEQRPDESIEEYYHRYLIHVFGDRADVELIGTAEYADTVRRDPVFMVRSPRAADHDP